MTYLQAKDSDKSGIKTIAYKLNPRIWESYDKMSKPFKQYIDRQRTHALNRATEKYYNQK